MPQLNVIKLTEPGYENFTGQMGALDFTNGVSDYGVSPQQAQSFLNNIDGDYVDGTPALQEALASAEDAFQALKAEFDAYKLAHPAS